VSPRLRSPRVLAAGLVLVLALPACSEVTAETSEEYEPAQLHAVKGRNDVKRVTFTADAAARTGLRTAEVRQQGRRKVVPYAALIYDAEGRVFVYSSRTPLSFVREHVKVDRIDGDRALLSAGPRVGTRVVTVGAAEVHGAELDVPGAH
jgi:hypothetical protein